MELELHGWKVKAALLALALLVVTLPLARSVKANKDRAEDWHRRAVVAEESVNGLRVVIVERSRALNRRTLQANLLATQLHSNGSALRRSKASVGTLSRRQRELAKENARVESQRRKLQSQLTTLEGIAGQLSACATPGKASAKGSRTITARSRKAACGRAGASFDAYLEHFG